jgi:hypothetical protein
MKITLYSWNVLHIIHELNHAIDSSPVLRKYPQEQTRLDDIVNTISKLIKSDTIFCLQEVPCDLLDTLGHKLKDCAILGYRYSRIPKLKNPKLINPYDEPAEHLVTIIHNDLLNNHEPTTNTVQYADAGKAALLVDLPTVTIINTHVPAAMGTKGRINAFKQLHKFMVDNKITNYILAGDMNASDIEIKTDLPFEDYKMAPLKGPTRKGENNKTIAYSKLDHIVVSKGINISSAVVHSDNDGGDMSDHFIVGAVVHISK